MNFPDFRHIFQMGAAHGNIEHRYPPAFVAWLMFKPGINSDQEKAFIDKWRNTKSFEDRCNADLWTQEAFEDAS